MIAPGAVAAVVLSFALATPAVAAMWMRISLDPSIPTARENVSVTVLTFAAIQNLCWDDPRITPIPEATWYGGGEAPVSLDLQMIVFSSSQRFTVPLVQRPGNGAYWDGVLVFPRGGEWQLYVKSAGSPPSPTSADRCGGFVRTVGVQPLGLAKSPNTQTPRRNASAGRLPEVLIVGAIGLAIAAAVLGALAVNRLRR